MFRRNKDDEGFYRGSAADKMVIVAAAIITAIGFYMILNPPDFSVLWGEPKPKPSDVITVPIFPATPPK